MNFTKVLVGGIFSVAMFNLIGCSDDDPAPVVEEEEPITIFELPAPLAAQTATIHIHDPLGIPSVTIASQPADIELSGTAERTAVGTVELELNATNNAVRTIFNLKAVVAAGSNLGDMGNIISSDGIFDGNPFVRFGQFGLAVEADEDSGTMIITDIDMNTTPVDPLVLNVVLPTTHVLAITHDDYYDTDTLTLLDVIGNDSTDYDMDFIGTGFDGFNGPGSVRNGVIAPDGNEVYYGSRNTANIYRLNLTNGDYDTKDLLTGDLYDQGEAELRYEDFEPTAHVESVFMSHNQQHLYATMHTGDHVYDNGTDTLQVANLVKLDRMTLDILGSVEIFDGADEPQTRDMEITADDSTAVLVMESADEDTAAAQLVIVDLNEMSVIKRVDISPTGTTDAGAMDPAPNNEPNDIALTADASAAFVSYRGEDDLYKVTLADGTFEKFTGMMMGVAMPPPTINGYIHIVDMGPDGMIYVGGDDGVTVVDPADAFNQTVIHTATSEVTTFDFSYDGNTLYLKDDNGGDKLFAYDLTQDPPAQLDLDGDTTDMTVGESTTQFYQWNENLVVTPY